MPTTNALKYGWDDFCFTTYKIVSVCILSNLAVFYRPSYYGALITVELTKYFQKKTIIARIMRYIKTAGFIFLGMLPGRG